MVNKIKSQKKKFLISFLIILLILALTGCWIMPGFPEWMMAEESVYYYWKAIINRQYELAKYYCIPGGVWYNKVDEWEEYINVNSEGEISLAIYGPTFYEQTEVIGDTAIAYTKIIVHKIAFPDNYKIYIDALAFEYEIELIKQNYPPGDWELK